jgi:hypothetical protein
MGADTSAEGGEDVASREIAFWGLGGVVVDG